jgi:hypothetical protein
LVASPSPHWCWSQRAAGRPLDRRASPPCVALPRLHTGVAPPALFADSRAAPPPRGRALLVFEPPSHSDAPAPRLPSTLHRARCVDDLPRALCRACVPGADPAPSAAARAGARRSLLCREPQLICPLLCLSPWPVALLRARRGNARRGPAPSPRRCAAGGSPPLDRRAPGDGAALAAPPPQFLSAPPPSCRPSALPFSASPPPPVPGAPAAAAPALPRSPPCPPKKHNTRQRTAAANAGGSRPEEA